MLIRAGALALAVSVAAFAGGPSCGMIAGWSPQGAPRAYIAENLFEYMDGNAEGYLLYGFVKMQGVTCEKNGATFVIDVSEFSDADSAFGMFSANRDQRRPVVKIGAAGQIAERRGLVVKGKYYLEIAANPEGDHSAALREWTAALEKTVEGSVDPPAALSWFPKEKQQSLRLVPESVLGLRVLKRGYLGQYEFGKAFVVLEDSAAAAAAVMQKLKTRFASAEPAKIADEALQTNDQYLGRLCIFRKGPYIGGYANVAESADPARLAAALSAALK